MHAAILYLRIIPKVCFFFSFHQFGFLFLHWFSTGNLDSRKKRILFQKNCWKLYYSLLLLYYPLALHAAHVFFFGFSIGVFVTLLWELLHLFSTYFNKLKKSVWTKLRMCTFLDMGDLWAHAWQRVVVHTCFLDSFLSFLFFTALLIPSFTTTLEAYTQSNTLLIAILFKIDPKWQF